MSKQLSIEGTPHIICRHEYICIVTEIPTDGISIQQEKRYVKCLLCDEILPIRVIEQMTIKVPLFGGRPIKKNKSELKPRGVASGIPPKGLRNWDCDIDGHCDPDNSGLCIMCSKDL